MEFLKDYSVNIKYHPGKANVVVDALSRKATVASVLVKQWQLLEDIKDLDVSFRLKHMGFLAELKIQPMILHKIKELQKNNKILTNIITDIENRPDFKIQEDGSLTYPDRLCTNGQGTQERIDGGSSSYEVHYASRLYKNLASPKTMILMD